MYVKRVCQEDFQKYSVALIEIAKARNRTSIVDAILGHRGDANDELTKSVVADVGKLKTKDKLGTLLQKENVTEEQRKKLLETWEHTQSIESIAEAYTFVNGQIGFVACLPNHTVCGVMKVRVKNDCIYVDNVAAFPSGTGAGAMLLHAAADLSEGLGKGGRLELFDGQRGSTRSNQNFYDKFGFTPLIAGAENLPWQQKDIKARDYDKPAIKDGKHNPDREAKLALRPPNEFWRDRWLNQVEQGAGRDISATPLHATAAKLRGGV